MSSDSDEEKQVDQLRRRVDELEGIVERMMPTRRDALKVGAGAAVGAGVLSLGSQSAGAQTAAGTVGTSANPVNVEAAAVNLDKINTGGGYGYEDVLSSRGFNTDFNAPPDRDISFNAVVKALSDNTLVNIDVDLGGQSFAVKQQQTLDKFRTLSIGPFRIPAGQRYRLKNFGDTPDYSLSRWIELR